MTWVGVANTGEFFYSTGDNGLVEYGQLSGDVAGVINAVEVQAIRGVTVEDTAPASGQILQYDGAQWAVIDLTAATSGQMHALLSDTHSDVVAGAPVRGDIIRGNATPEWEALSLGAVELVLYSDGTDLVYTRIGSATPADDGLVTAPAFTFDSDRTSGAYLPASGSVGLVANSDELITLDGINTQITLDAGQVLQTRTGGTDTLTAADFIYFANAAPSTVTLPAAPTTGQVFYIKDSGGNATGGNPVTVAGNGNNIDGNASVQIRNSFGSLTVVYNGTQWNII